MKRDRLLKVMSFLTREFKVTGVTKIRLHRLIQTATDMSAKNDLLRAELEQLLEIENKKNEMEEQKESERPA